MDIVKAEITVDRQDQIVDLEAFLGQLLGRAIDMCVILGEAAHTQQPMERPGGFIAVYLAKLCQLDRQIPVGLDPLIIDQHVTGAVHRLERVFAIILRFCLEHVFAVVLPVTRRFPQTPVHDVR